MAQLGVALVAVVLIGGAYFVWKSFQGCSSVDLDYKLARQAYEDAAETFREEAVGLKKEKALFNQLCREMISTQLLMSGDPSLTPEDEHNAFVNVEMERRRSAINTESVRDDFTWDDCK